MKGPALALAVVVGICTMVRFAPPQPAADDALLPAAEAATTDSELSRLGDLKVAIDRRVAEKERLYARLIAGEGSLAEAAREFLALNREWPPVPAGRYDGFPGRTLGERIGGLLAEGVGVRLRDDPRRDEVLGRLACEQEALTGLEPGWEFARPAPTAAGWPPRPRRSASELREWRDPGPRPATTVAVCE